MTFRSVLEIGPTVVLRGLATAINLGFILLCAHRLDPSGLGIYYLSLTITAILTTCLFAPWESHLQRFSAPDLAQGVLFRPLIAGGLAQGWPLLFAQVPIAALACGVLLPHEALGSCLTVIALATTSGAASLVRTLAAGCGRPLLASGLLLGEAILRTGSFWLVVGPSGGHPLTPLLCSAGALAVVTAAGILLLRPNVAPGEPQARDHRGSLPGALAQLAPGNLLNLVMTQGYRPVGHALGLTEAMGAFALIFNLGATASGVLTSSIIQVRTPDLLRHGMNAVGKSLGQIALALGLGILALPWIIAQGLPLFGKADLAGSWPYALLGATSDACSAAIGIGATALAAQGLGFGGILFAATIATLTWCLLSAVFAWLMVPPWILFAVPMLVAQATSAGIIHRHLLRRTSP